MRFLVTAAVAAMALAGCSEKAVTGAANTQAAAAARPPDAESEAYMRKAEADWAQLFVQNDPALLQRVLADDFTGFFSNGSLHNKAETIASDTPDPAFKTARLDYVHYRHFGDTVVAQGQESAQRKDGGPDLVLIWTDVWLWRGGKWQVVASHVARAPGKK